MINIINNILLDWDLAGLKESNVPEDEYITESQMIYDYINKGKNLTDLGKYIYTIFNDFFGCDIIRSDINEFNLLAECIKKEIL